MGKSILVTGGAGFIGQHLCRKLLISGHDVRILDSLQPQIHGSKPKLSDFTCEGRVEFIQGDVRDRAALERAVTEVDMVVHLAAETGTGQSMYQIAQYFSVNVQGTALLLDVLQNESCARDIQSIVMASSRAIYGEGAYRCAMHGLVYPEQRTVERLSSGRFEPVCPACGDPLELLPTPESAPFKPMSIYGLTKQVQEQAILMYARNRRINGFGLRYQNVYGPGQSLKNPYTGILAVFSNLARQNLPIEIYEDGQESRDFVYIDDVVEATLRCIDFSGNYIGALNVGSGKATTVMQVAEKIRAFFRSDSSIAVSGAYRAGDIRHNIADMSLTNEVLEFVPGEPFEKGLHHFLRWVCAQNHEDGANYIRSVEELQAKGLMGNQQVGA
ncbi:SDR family NAD(P)-dependent oxidoreductase [Propionivibrio sp.]|uniref:SDR family NAD(P)-dependent oxidoreductase n=1 Tax=Propionivibrio sp. TaxID=2212460 RepID=UPI00260C99FC|nr:SDR family NAD(P)-dependent oxidoreductase [Propionivibrio sp.]